MCRRRDEDLASRAVVRGSHDGRVRGWQSLEVSLFRWINRDWAHPWMDVAMGLLTGNSFFVPALLALLAVAVWRAGRKGVVLVVMVGAALAFANACVADPLKDWIARGRPYVVLDDVILRVGRGNPFGSMPSGHAMNCALLAAVGGWYFRGSLWVTVPLAAGVALSRVYNGAHFPTDVLAGAALGVASAALVGFVLDRLWGWVGPRFAPGWAVRMPSLLHPNAPAVVVDSPGAGTSPGPGPGPDSE